MIAMAMKRSAGPNAKRAAQPARSAALCRLPCRIRTGSSSPRTASRSAARYHVALARRSGRTGTTAVRAALGRRGPCFFSVPRWCTGRGLQPWSRGGFVGQRRFAEVQPRARGLAQMAALELHTWGPPARADRADRVTFDIDPDPALPWPASAQPPGPCEFVASLASTRLKTSGGAQAASSSLRAVCRRSPPQPRSRKRSRRTSRGASELFTARRGTASRKPHVIDWQRSQQGATTVAAYSPRWRKGAPVSTPIRVVGKLDLRGAIST